MKSSIEPPRPATFTRPTFANGSAIVAIAVRLAGFVLLWWVMAEGQWQDPVLIGGIVLVSTLVSLFLWPPGVWRWRPLAVLAFLPWFLWQSLCGGFDVSRRAFQRKPALRPEIIPATVRLPVQASCLFAWIIRLLPGTACISKEGEDFRIHLLDAASADKVGELEKRIERLVR